MPVSAKATSAWLPASRAACANSTDPKVPGGRNMTCPSMRCGANALAMSAWAVAGTGAIISSAPRTASSMSFVTSAAFASWRPAKSFTSIIPPAAQWAAHRCFIAAPQLHLVAGESKIPRRGKRAIATPENGNPHQLSLAVTMRGRVIPSHYIRTDASARSTLGTDRVARMSQRGRAKGAPPWRHAGVPRISRRVWLGRERARLSGAPLIRATGLICTAVDYARERHPTNIRTDASG